jgi:UDP-2,4-diacetamido-2,4,6-trideoxy-beta-L-altropyranose hydrolase
MRCLTLAGELRQRGDIVEFVCAELSGAALELVLARGFALHGIPALAEEPDGDRSAGIAADRHASWIVVDHYELSDVWERRVAATGARVLAVDDLADRKHAANILLDQNLQHDPWRYEKLVPPECVQLLGPRFALLRPQFSNALRRARSGTVARVLVTFGGSDPAGMTERSLAWLGKREVAVDVVAGPANPRGDAIRKLCSERPAWTYHASVDDMASLMGTADMAIGAPGSTTWERCFIGIPSVLVALADNQELIGEAADAEGLAVYVGRDDRVDDADARLAVTELIDDEPLRTAMSQRCLACVDGLGRCRVADAVHELTGAQM